MKQNTSITVVNEIIGGNIGNVSNDRHRLLFVNLHLPEGTCIGSMALV